jgi:hypothetical protein
MSRRATFADSKAAVNEREQRRGLSEYVMSLRHDGWSHPICMTIYEGGPFKETDGIFMGEELPENGRAPARVERAITARAVVRSQDEQEDPRAHGLELPTQNRTSGRKRNDEPPPPRLALLGYGPN